MGPDMGYVDEKPADPLTVDVYPSGRSSYTLYEDDGKSNDYKTGAFARTTFTSDATGNQAIFEISAAQGDYRGKLASRTYILKMNRPAAALREVTRNGAALQRHASQAAFESAQNGWFNDTSGSTVWVKFNTPTATANRVVFTQ
jgi:hypothetical protein